jgi:transposase
MRGIWDVLATGCRGEYVPWDLGCSGRTANRRLKRWEELRIWDRLHLHLLKLLRKVGELEEEMCLPLLKRTETTSSELELLEKTTMAACRSQGHHARRGSGVN